MSARYRDDDSSGRDRRKQRKVAAPLLLEFELAAFDAFANLIVADDRLGDLWRAGEVIGMLDLTGAPVAEGGRDGRVVAWQSMIMRWFRPCESGACGDAGGIDEQLVHAHPARRQPLREGGLLERLDRRAISSMP